MVQRITERPGQKKIRINGNRIWFIVKVSINLTKEKTVQSGVLQEERTRRSERMKKHRCVRKLKL